jgi:hypothetical protein
LVTITPPYLLEANHTGPFFLGNSLLTKGRTDLQNPRNSADSKPVTNLQRRSADKAERLVKPQALASAAACFAAAFFSGAFSTRSALIGSGSL